MDKFLKDAFTANMLRGTHSSGIFQVAQGDSSISSYKRALTGYSFASMQDARAILDKSNRARATVCHVRAATTGAVTDVNAHPFVITREDTSKLVGVHNGTLTNWRNKEGAAGEDVDSAWAFKMLAEHGMDAFKYFNGAFAFVWFDSREPDYIYIARNEQRPLFMMLSEDRKTIIGASELGMLGWLTERNGIKGVADNKERFFYTEPGYVYKYSLKDIGSRDRSKFPAYDPSTTIQPPPARHTNMYSQGGRYPPTHWRHHEEDDPVRYYTRQSNFRNDQEDIIDDVKKALKKARNRRDVASMMMLDENLSPENRALAEAIASSVAEWENTSEAPFPEDIFPIIVPQNPEVVKGIYLMDAVDKGATTAEIESAKNLRVYGQVAEFNGLIYDDDTSSVMGQLIFMEDGQYVEAEAEIRGLSSKAAKKYIDIARVVSIVGFNANKDNTHLPEFYVVSDPTEASKKMLASIKIPSARRVN